MHIEMGDDGMMPSFRYKTDPSIYNRILQPFPRKINSKLLIQSYLDSTPNLNKRK